MICGPVDTLFRDFLLKDRRIDERRDIRLTHVWDDCERIHPYDPERPPDVDTIVPVETDSSEMPEYFYINNGQQARTLRFKYEGELHDEETDQLHMLAVLLAYSSAADRLRVSS